MNSDDPGLYGVRMFGSAIVFVFSFISARSANKGASGSPSDWLPAGAPLTLLCRELRHNRWIARALLLPPPPPPGCTSPSDCSNGRRASELTEEFKPFLTESRVVVDGKKRRRRGRRTGEPASPGLVSRNRISKSGQESYRGVHVAK